MSQIRKSNKLNNVCYDIRGPVLQEAKRLEEDGHKILKLNIGNPAPWGFDAPDEIVQDVIYNLPSAQGYCDSKGKFIKLNRTDRSFILWILYVLWKKVWIFVFISVV